MSVTGQPNSEPTRVGTSIGDITAGLFTTIGINAALYDREKTGKWTFIDVSMLDCQIAILENAIARYLSKNEIPKPMGSRHPSIAPFEAFKTKDSHIIIAAGNNKLFEKLCSVLNIPEISKDSRFNTNSLRSENIDELKKILEDKLVVNSTNVWVSKMEKEKIVGVHEVIILLKVRPFDVYEINLSDEKSKKFISIIEDAKKNKISIQKISNEKIYEITNVKSHQGVLAIAKKKKDIYEN